MIRRTVGSYTIVEKIGSGGMGEVYFAEHKRIARRAAIKFLLPSLSRDSDVVARFFNEARATSLIKHPGIVEIYDCDVVEDRAYIVMEYLDGESLASAIARTGGFAGEVSSILSVAGQIASALSAAHAKGIVHRDLKPENVFLATDDKSGAPFVAKILDFGIAKLAVDNVGVASHTRTGSLLGTPVYMAPEQCRGLSTVDYRADIYALGCIMFELVTGRQLFIKEAPGDLLVAHISEQAPATASFKPGIPTALDRLIARMLAKKPEERPTSMDSVVAEIEEMLGVKASEFARKIPATSAMSLPSLARRRRTTSVMPAVMRTTPMPPLGPLESGGHPAAEVGGTKLLPNDSTFRRSASEIIASASGGRRPRWIPIALAVVAGGAAMGVVAMLVKPGTATVRPVVVEAPAPAPPAPNPVPAPRQLVPPPPTEPAPPASDRASIRITSQPAGAELWLVGETVSRGRTPLEVALPRHSPLVDAVLKQPGYVERRIAIDPERAEPINVALEKEKSGHHAAVRSSKHAAVAKHPEEAKAVVKPKPPGYFGVGD
jgi:serine/threonine-protein kinase